LKFKNSKALELLLHIFKYSYHNITVFEVIS
jgi:hypothetical protein